MKFNPILLLVFWAFTSYGQNQLKIQINDTDQFPIMGAEVSFPELHKGVITDENGAASIALPKGTHQITVHYLGFNPQDISVSIPEQTSITIVLEESVFGLDEIMVSTPFNQLQSQNVMKVESASLAEMRAQGSFDLADGISKMAGASQRSSGTSLSKPVIRGLSGNRILVYTQGVRLENQQFGDDHSLGINQAGNSSVELIKGPASLLYGSDALGGVLYINPEKFAAANSDKLELDQSFNSSTLGSNTSAMYAKSFDDFGFMARGTYNANMDYVVPGGEYVTNSRFKETDFKAGINFDGLGQNTQIRYSYNHNISGIIEAAHKEDHEEHEEFYSHDREKSYTAEEPYQDVTMQIISIHNHFLIGNGKLVTNIGLSQNDRKEVEHHEEHGEEEIHEEEEHHEDEEASLWMKLNTITYDVQYKLNPENDLKWVFAVQGLNQENTNYGEEELIPDANTNDIGAYMAVNFSKEKHNLQAGVRFDNRNIKTSDFSNNYSSFNGSLGYKYDYNDAFKIRLNLASGFRAPNLAELASDGVHHGSNRYEIGNQNLESEQNVQIDLNLSLDTDHYELYMNGFYNYINNYIYLDQTDQTIDGFTVYNYTQNNAKLYGGEAGIHIHPHPYDWFHFESNYQIVVGELYDGSALPFIPPGKWDNTLRFEFDSGKTLKKPFVALNYEYNFAQERVSGLETATPSYGLLNFNSGLLWQFSGAKLGANFNILNILDTAYIPHLSRFKEFGINNPGRSFMLGLNLNI